MGGGRSGIYETDCLYMMRKLDDASIDLIVSDPPYLINYHTGRRKDKEHDFCKPIQNDDNPELIQEYFRECHRVLKPNSAFYCFTSERTVEFFKDAASAVGFRCKNSIIWEKNAWTSGDLKAAFGFQYEVLLLFNKGRSYLRGNRIGDVWKFPRVTGKQQVHQNQKPVELIERCINYHSNPGDLVFDGFMGSGTTAIAATRTGRRFLGCEIEPRYFKLVVNRLKEEGIAHESNQTVRGDV